MAATVFGTAHLYGITGTVTNATVLSFRKKSEHALKAATQDESGVEIERRYDDIHDEATIGLKYRSAYSIPAPGSTLSYESATWEVTAVEKAETNNGFREVTLSIKKSAGISYS